MATKYTESKIRLARVIVAPPKQVYDELKDYGAKLALDYFGGADEELERTLLARNDSLINLGLARYGGTSEVLKLLYRKSGEPQTDPQRAKYFRGLRIAVLANEGTCHGFTGFPSSVMEVAELIRLVAEGDEDELAVLLSNPSIEAELLAKLYERTGIFESLPEDRWRRLILLTQENPRLVTDKGNEHGPDLGFMHLSSAILKLLSSAPATEQWLRSIRQVLDHLDPSKVAYPDQSIAPILERWFKMPASDDEREGNYTSLSFRDETLCLIAALYGRHYSKESDRKYVANQLGGPDSPNVFHRCAYYAKAELSAKEMAEGYARDGDTYTFAALFNNNIFRKQDLRKLLEQDQLRGFLAGLYRQRCEQLRKEWAWFDPRPTAEWLVDEQAPLSKEMSLLEQLEARVTEISKNVAHVQTWLVWGLIGMAVLIVYRTH